MENTNDNVEYFARDNVIFSALINGDDHTIIVKRELFEEEVGDGPLTHLSFERWVDDCRAWLTDLAKRKIASEKVAGGAVTVTSIDRWR
jgi:hypothetical protein